MPDDPQQSAVEAVRQIATQILTLCTSLIAAGVAFAKIGAPLPRSHGVLFSALVAFGLAIAFGIATLMAVTSVLANGSFDVARANYVRFFAGLQIVLFIVGMICLIVLAYQLLYPAR